jgi:two-component system, NtrC family, response regulator AtoC
MNAEYPVYPVASHEANGGQRLGTIRVQPRDADNHHRGDYDPFSNSPAMLAVKKIVDRVAPTDATVLISGESGVGKELVARTVHQESPRRSQPFIKVNCAALPKDLLESELFGYERGAFTGAQRSKPGRFELANSGTIFLDEIGEMPLPVQAKLLHVLQDREFSRLGSRHDVRVDVRVVAATNRDLALLADCGRFREDLYYRLNVVGIHLPLLRDRREEIPALVDHFLDRYSRQYLRPRPDISPATMEVFLSYAWPGNIRELENTVKRIVLMGTEDWVKSTHASHASTPPPPHAAIAVTLPAPLPSGGDRPSLKEIARMAALHAECGALKQALDRTRWNRREAARQLKVSYRTLRRKIEQCGLED